MFTNFFPNLGRVLEKYWALFLQGAGYTLLLSFITVLFGTILGSLLALMRRSPNKIVSGFATGYVEVIRGTPLLLQLYLFYFMLPELLPMLNLSKFACVSIALVINSSAYVCEVVRAGIQAVDFGQTEAARTLGLSARQTMLRIVMPQAVKNILPALGNEFVTVIKETSLASTFFVGDLMTQYSTVRGSMYLVIEPLIVVGAIYFILTFTLSKAVNAFERRLKVSD
ncbi:MAG: amino acid ABC transporter permease [Eubacteriales bacterium]|jgi:His/Glu/Gln/Arg/opine family amino acid ABC transporter permease subunit|nr:amino acid ABC transporter permease [Eubacteriales bacterium]MDD3572593.1 amino acid ABC transporter permease [Eubacteriales bacterium]MDD4135059.1 amino acid ABC transporter permease [Eubacteriales bacterium]NLO12662.1 amino acid ABC transporter permease [Clostridiales bacterium]